MPDTPIKGLVISGYHAMSCRSQQTSLHGFAIAAVTEVNDAFLFSWNRTVFRIPPGELVC